MKRFVYADNAATTKISDAVLDSMLPYLKEHYGNPSSIYSIGRDAKIAVENARKQVAEALGCEPREIFFTSGGSEADNWAIKGAAYAQKAKGKTHIITTNFEHHAVLHAVQALEKEGFDVTYLSVDEKGLISPSQVADAIRDDTALVTIMYANNEIGTILPIAEIGKICREKKVLFHTDAVQAVGHVAIDVKEQNIDLLSLSAHKLHGPKGVGALYCRKGVVIRNLIDGGAQERGKRASTENVAGIVGLATAITESTEHLEENAKKMAAMRDRLIGHILKIDRTRLNGDREKRLPGNANFSFEGVEGESLLLMLDLSGVCASSGSLDPSHVLLAIGLPHEVAHGSLRLSVSEYNTDEDIEYICSIIDGIIERLRAMSPLWERIVKEGKES